MLATCCHTFKHQHHLCLPKTFPCLHSSTWWQGYNCLTTRVVLQESRSGESVALEDSPLPLHAHSKLIIYTERFGMWSQYVCDFVNVDSFLVRARSYHGFSEPLRTRYSFIMDVTVSSTSMKNVTDQWRMWLMGLQVVAVAELWCLSTKKEALWHVHT